MKLGLDEIEKVCKIVLEMLPDGGVIALRGDLASGKTTFTKKFVELLGCSDSVTSPTFSLQHIYGDGLYHYDLYNYGFERFLSLGMMEELERDGYHLIEWADGKLLDLLKLSGIKCVIVDIDKCYDNMRCYGVKYV